MADIPFIVPANGNTTNRLLKQNLDLINRYLVDGSVSGTIPSSSIAADTVGVGASDGNVGEYTVTSTLRSAPVSLTTATPANVLSQVITPGTYVIHALFGFTDVSLKTDYAVSFTSATLPSTDRLAVPNLLFTGEVMGTFVSLSPGDVTHSLFSYAIITANVTAYLVAQTAFAASTTKAYGSIHVYRVF